MRQPRARALVEPDACERHDHTECVGEHVAHRANHRRVLSVDLRQHARRLVQMPSLVSGNLFLLDGLDRTWTRGSGSSSQDCQGSSMESRSIPGSAQRGCAAHLDLVGPGPGIVEQTRRNEACSHNDRPSGKSPSRCLKRCPNPPKVFRPKQIFRPEYARAAEPGVRAMP